MPDYQGSKIDSVWHRRWGGVGVQVKEAKFSSPFRADLRSDCARFSVVLDLAGGQPEARSSVLRPTAIGENTIHQMNFATAECPVWACSDDTKYFRALSVLFKHEDIDYLLEANIAPERVFVPRLMFFDRSLLHIARLLELECDSQDFVDELYIETLVLAFLLRLANLERSRPRQQARGGWTSYQLRRVTEYICEHLTDGISLQELAGITGLSRSYFSRAFRESTGVPPHQWLLEKRIQKSREYLLNTDLSVAQVALAVGFSDQAHFSRVFNRIAGTSPATWRRSSFPRMMSEVAQ